MNFEEIKEMFACKKAGVKSIKAAPNTFYFDNEDGTYSLVLHNNTIVVYSKDKFQLFNRGWNTKTTKDRINKFTPFQCFSENFEWYVQFLNAKGDFEKSEFFEGMTFIKKEQGYKLTI
jgi:hypothetical protein